MWKLRTLALATAVMLPFGMKALPFKLDSVNLDEKNLDSLISVMQQPAAPSDEIVSTVITDSSSLVVDHSDAFYIERLNKIPSVIQLTYNDIVKKCISVYTVRKRDKLAEILALKDYYFPIYEEILDKYNVPQEFKYLSVIESALNPRALSRAGAAGLWQFMPGTGRLYKLTINSFVDERRDLYASTNAAARYLRDLYSVYNDWGLVIAAYNCGPGNVNKAIRRSGGKRGYWEIYSYLPRETRSYYPLYIAATYAMNYYKDHNIVPMQLSLLPASDTIMVSENIHFQQIADVLNVPVTLIRDLNPQYRRDVVPGKFVASPLRLPEKESLDFIDLKDSIVRYKSDVFFANSFKVMSPSSSRNSRYASSDVSSKSQKIHHKVHSGETLGQIASKYNVSVSDLRYWNDISGNKIKVGRSLVVYTDRNSAKVNSSSSKAAEKVAESTGEYITYKVKSGDTIWGIASAYNVSGEDLMKWNDIGEANKIKPGQTIKIKKLN
jgi:membrane-bound lytic murein transglycosylase D